MSTRRQATFSDNDKQMSVRRILLGRSTPLDEARKRRISVRSMEEWLNDPKIRGQLRITVKSGWHPKKYTLAFKEEIVERVKAGEPPAKIAKEFLGLFAGTIRNWAMGFDMEPEFELNSRAPNPPKLVTEEPEVSAPAARHPLRDEAVRAYRGGMTPVEIIKALDLNVSVDAIRDWAAEDPKPRAVRSIGRHGAISRWSEEEQRTAVRRVAAGESRQKIAGELGCSDALIYLWQKRYGKDGNGAYTQPSGGTGPNSPFSAEQRRDAAERWARGYAAEDIANNMGVDKSTVYTWAREFKIERPPEIARARDTTINPDQFRETAIRRVLDEKEANGIVARDMGLSAQSLSQWVIKERLRRLQVEKDRVQAAQQPPPAPPAPAAPPPPPAPVPQPPAPPAPSYYAVGNGQNGKSTYTNASNGSGSIAVPAAAPAARKVVLMTVYACPHCSQAISVPPAVPGQLRVTQGTCPHCEGVVEL